MMIATATNCPSRKNEMKSKKKLAALLADLLTDACANRGKAHSLHLKGGLRIDLKVDADDIAHLALSRVDQPPAPLEWTIVIRDIGAPKGTTYVERVPEPKHTPYQHRVEPIRVYLVGEWALQPELIAMPEEAA